MLVLYIISPSGFSCSALYKDMEIQEPHKPQCCTAWSPKYWWQQNWKKDSSSNFVLSSSCMCWTSCNCQSSPLTDSSKVKLLFQLLQNNNHQDLKKIAENGDMNIAHSITCFKTVTDTKKLIAKGATDMHKRCLLSNTKMLNKLTMLQNIIISVNKSLKTFQALSFFHLLNFHFLIMHGNLKNNTEFTLNPFTDEVFYMEKRCKFRNKFSRFSWYTVVLLYAYFVSRSWANSYLG